MIVEIASIIGFAGLISAWAVWAYPTLKGGEGVPKKAMVFTQGECSYGLLANERDEKRIKDWKESQEISLRNKANLFLVDKETSTRE